MHRLLALALAGTALLATAAYGAPALVPAAEIGPQDTPRIEVLSASTSGLSLSFDLPFVAVERATVNGRDFQSFAIPGGNISGDVGDPALPVFTRFLAVPEGASVIVTATAEDVEEMSNVDLLPVLDESASKVTWSAESYARDDFGTDLQVQAGEPAILRGLRVVPVTFYPVQYNPAQRTVRVAGRMRVDVRFEAGGDPLNARAVRSVPSTQSFDRIYRSLVMNYEPPAGKTAGAPYGTCLIICPNDTQVTSRLQPLVDWRKKKGFPVMLATTAQTGTTSASIKSYIQTAYNTWPVPPEYIVLVGDASGSYLIPTWYDPQYNGEGDFPYVQLDGTDLLPDAHIGRLSINSTQDLDLEVQKMTGYEGTPFLTDPGWYTRAALVGDPNTSGISCIHVMQWIKSRLLEMNYTQVDTVFSAPFVSEMSNAFNRGDTYIAYRGYYGMSGWSNSNTNALTNSWKMPFAAILTCGTGSFAGSTSISEGFLRAGSGTTASPRGAIGALGVATLSTHTRFNNTLEYGLFQGLLYDGLFEMGAALTRAKLELYLNYITREPAFVTAYSYWVNLMGDPAGEVFSGYPDPIAVSHPSSLPLGTNSLVVGVTEGGSASEGARVCAWKGTEAQVVGFTDAAGHCELALPAMTEGNLVLTVTKHDRFPFSVNVPVSKPPSFVGYVSSTVDDDTTSTSEGNGDGFVNPGESIELRVRVKNFSSSPASSVTATLSSDDPFVTITDPTEIFGNVPVDSLRWSEDDFDFTVGYPVREGHVLTFALDVHSGSEQWHSLIEIPVKAPDLTASGQTLYNAGGNGALDPGETIELSVRLQNNGGLSGQGVVAQLRSMSPFVVVTDTSAVYGTINTGSFAENTSDRFTVTANPGTYQGHLAVFLLSTVSNNGMRDTTFVTLPVGQATSDDPIGPDQYGYYAFDNTDVGYGEAPVYNWIELDPLFGGNGTEVVLQDYGDAQDKSITVTLPFQFQFYGETFSRATICSNGWIAMDSTYLTLYRNYTIPGAGAPANLVAVFWDDLYRSGNAKVFQKYDASAHTWIVEWSRLLNAYNGSSTEVFEAIFYDPAFYPTSSHDGEIVFQYNTVNNVDGMDGYATVGIQNRDHTDGVLYTYANAYPAAAATLQAGRAIKFVPVQAVPMGVVTGIVRNASAGNVPIPGAQVRLLENGRSYTSGADGTYTGGSQEGTYTAVASHQGFAPDTVTTVVVSQSQTTTVNFDLTDIAGPVISNVSDLATTTDTSGPYVVHAEISDFSGVTSAVLYFRVNGSSWMQAPMTLAAGIYTGEITGWPAGTKIDYYVWAQDSNAFASVHPEGAPDSFYSLYITSVTYAYDAESADAAWLLGMTGDTAATGFWVRVDPNGTVYNGQVVAPENDHTPDPGTMCFVTGNGNPGDPPGNADVDGGCTSLRSPIFDLSTATRAFVHYARWFGENGNADDNEFAIDVSNDGGQSWTPVERVQNNEAVWDVVSIDITTLIQLTSQVTFRFQACDTGTPGLIEGGVDDFSMETFTPNQIAAPQEIPVPTPLALEQSRPNPFARQAAIGFSLPKAETVKLDVYDVQGRTVRRLIDGPRPAGAQVIFWDGRDDRGRLSPAGVYFYKLQTSGGERVRKILRVN